MNWLNFSFDWSGNDPKLAAKCKKNVEKNLTNLNVLKWYKTIPVVEFSFEEQFCDQECNCEVVYTALQTSGSQEK